MIPQALPPAEAAPAPAPAVRAQYGWGYAGADGEGVGTLSLLMDPASGRLVAELHGLGERLMLLEGTAATGYRLQIPRQQVDETWPSLAQASIPFLPGVPSVAALVKLLSTGEGAGVTVKKRDAIGPLKLHWAGRDARGKAQQVWLDRKRWEPARQGPDALGRPGSR